MIRLGRLAPKCRSALLRTRERSVASFAVFSRAHLTCAGALFSAELSPSSQSGFKCSSHISRTPLIFIPHKQQMPLWRTNISRRCLLVSGFLASTWYGLWSIFRISRIRRGATSRERGKLLRPLLRRQNIRCGWICRLRRSGHAISRYAGASKPPCILTCCRFGAFG